MLDPDPILDAIVETLQSLPQLVVAMNGDKHRIKAHHDYYGVDLRLSETVYKLEPPAILVAYDTMLGGNFDGAVRWKHRFHAYLRLGSQAGAESPMGYGGLWRLAMHTGPALAFDGSGGWAGSNIRNIEVYPGLYPMETPTLVRMKDEEGMDFFVGMMTFAEHGDN